MSDVSVPPTHPDDELVTRKILREELDQRFREQETRLDAKLDQRFSEQDGRFETKLDQRFSEQDARLDQRFSEQNARLDDLAGQIRGLEESMISKVVAALEQRESQRIAKLNTRTLNIGARTTDLETDVEDLTTRTALIERQIRALKKRAPARRTRPARGSTTRAVRRSKKR